MRGFVIHAWQWATALRNDCFIELSYHFCCELHPGHPAFRALCWDEEFAFEDCCYAHGPEVHLLPNVWEESLELVFPNLEPITIMQDPRDGEVLHK